MKNAILVILDKSFDKWVTVVAYLQNVDTPTNVACHAVAKRSSTVAL